MKAIIFAAASVIVASAQVNQQPTFSAGARLVQVDAIVRNGKGPVPGLTKDDFTLLDNGKPQKIAFFLVRAAREHSAPAIPLPPGTISNRLNSRGETPGTATILLIDRLNTPVTSQSYANQKVIRFLQARGNRDAIAIYTLGSQVRVVQDLTSDSDRLERAVKSLKPENVRRLTNDVHVDPTGDARTDEMIARSLEGLEDIIAEDRAGTTSQALVAIAHHLAKVPGRKNLIWISGSFPLFIQRAHYNVDLSPEAEKAARALNEADMAIYPVDARGMTGTLSGSGAVQAAEDGKRTRCNPLVDACGAPGVNPISAPAGLDTMNMLAGLTGGRAYYNSNGIEESILQTVDDSELTYTLGFYPAEESQNGTYHKLAVKVSAKGANVHYRKGYFAFKAEAREPHPALQELLDDPLDAVEIGLLASAKPDETRQGSYRIKVSVDIRDLALTHENGRRSGKFDLSFFLPRSGSVRTKGVTLNVPDNEFAALLEKGVELDESIDTEEKEGDLRVVVQDRTSGSAGSLHIHLAR